MCRRDNLISAGSLWWWMETTFYRNQGEARKTFKKLLQYHRWVIEVAWIRVAEAEVEGVRFSTYFGGRARFAEHECQRERKELRMRQTCDMCAPGEMEWQFTEMRKVTGKQGRTVLRNSGTCFRPVYKSKWWFPCSPELATVRGCCFWSLNASCHLTSSCQMATFIGHVLVRKELGCSQILFPDLQLFLKKKT